MIICAGDIETFEFAQPIGIGMINSSINLTKMILQFCPSKIIFIGTAGSYGDHQIFDIVKSSSASNIELSFLENKSYTPIDNVIAIDKESEIVNSSNYISTDFELTKQLKKFKITLENMEFFSILSCAKKFNIDVVGYFVITNYCDQNAHNLFLNNHKKAMSILSRYLYENKIVSRETFGDKL